MGDRWNAMREPVALEDYAEESHRRLQDLRDWPPDEGMRLLPARPTDVGEMRLLPALRNTGLLDARLFNLSDAQAEMFPDHAPASRDVAGMQVAQGWNGIPSIPVPRLPPSTRGYDIERRGALEGLDSAQENLNQNGEFRARARQAEIGQFDVERRRSAASQSPDAYFARQPRQPYVTDQNSIAPVGRGDTYMSSGPFGQKYYVDRNGDGTSDVILQYRDGKTYADFGDEEGFSVYSRQRYRPAPPPPSGRR